MKQLCITLLLSFLFINVFAGENDSLLGEKNVRERILKDIQQNLDQKNKVLDSTILKLDDKVGKLDSVLKLTGNPKERIDRLVERVQILEEKQKAVEQNEINVYEANYQSAMINLVSMDREIKPLILFHATKDFFTSLTETSNPMSYEEFRKGFDQYRAYVDKTKDKSATQKAASEVIGASGYVSAGVPIVGAYSQLIFSSMAEYVNSIGHKRRERKAEAQKMFSITATLSQFTTERNQIENEWEGITQSLEEMQVYYDTVMNRNMRMLQCGKNEVCTEFTRENDASRRYQYLTALRDRSAEYVLKMKKEHPKEWKEDIYYQLMDVQTLKIKYGDITYHIVHHINKYAALITKFKGNKDIGPNVARLETKLSQLKATFDDTFEPFQYAHSATQMYKVM